jgi:hypothetical protein
LWYDAGTGGLEDGDTAMAIDDLILTWLAHEPCPAETQTDFGDWDCPSCGYIGWMIVEAGHSFCPACFGKLPELRAEELRRIVHCPNCDAEIVLSDGDRNKTIVCSHCKFFLGCIYRDEPSRQLEVFGIHLPSLLRSVLRRGNHGEPERCGSQTHGCFRAGSDNDQGR